MNYWSIFKICIFLAVLLMAAVLQAQEGIIRGTVYDKNTGESLPGLNIIIDSEIIAVTDGQGNYNQSLSAGDHVLVFKFIGYRDKTVTINLLAGQELHKDIYLHQQSVELSTAVVSASKYEQRLSDVTVSMEVIPASFIKDVNTYYIDETISLMPGIDIIDGQANIRGGSGYTYGAGSRVLVLLDGMPILSGGVGDVKWNALPTEIIGQVEILKGASSALYGTSALNGVINLRTATPGTKPETSAEFSLGAYMMPEREEMAWFWDRNPLFGNLKFSHLRKAGAFDIAISGSGLYDEGYRQDNDMQYIRLNTGIRYHPVKIERFSLGLNIGFQLQDLTDFLIWQDADSGAWIQNPDAITPMKVNRLNIDPYALFFDKVGSMHSLSTRYYQVINRFEEDADKDNDSYVYFGEYRYQKTFFQSLTMSLGAAFSYTEGKTSLYGNHYGSTQALYAQLDHKFFDRLGLSLGLRWERYTLDKSDKESRPVFRAGINYEAAKLTFLRASFGQGYRYPSMAEKYTSTGLGGLKIFPNEDLTPETGWSAEVGIKQGYLINSWSGYIDVAGYWTEYNDMIEFVFGLHNPKGVPPSIDYIGFKSVNTGKARINGVDISVAGQGDVGPMILKYFAGYTFMNPVDYSNDSISGDTTESQILKYRYKHSVKGDLAFLFKGFELGLTMVYRSFMERIDAAFEEEILGQYFFPGLKEYRQENNTGSIVFNLGWLGSLRHHQKFHCILTIFSTKSIWGALATFSHLGA